MHKRIPKPKGPALGNALASIFGIGSFDKKVKDTDVQKDTEVQKT